MTTFTESRHAAEFIMSEANGKRHEPRTASGARATALCERASASGLGRMRAAWAKRAGSTWCGSTAR